MIFGFNVYAILKPWKKINFLNLIGPLSQSFLWKKPITMRWNIGFPKLLTNA